MTTRRTMLAGLAAAAILPRRGWAAVGAPAYLAAGRRPDGSHALHGLGADGAVVFAVPLPDRGHAAAAHPDRPVAVAFARRPGTFGVALDCRDGRVLARLTPPPGRQFNGHGAFSADGARLYTSEVVAEGSAGRIGVWDAEAGFQRIGEWDSGGIGPHDLRRDAAGRLVVANGGIQTDPTDRTPLNLDRMRPNLTVLDETGAILSLRELPGDLAQNSIRHLALLPQGAAFAMQWQGDAADPVPLLGIAPPDGALTLCPCPEADAFAMQGYAGSVAADADGRIVVTSPRGGVAMIFAADGTHRATLRRADLCGAAPAPQGGFTLTDGGGAVWAADEGGLRLLARHDLAWDNHLIALESARGT
ncbi:DUF1513 domain-containing protein [Paracoccus luteus]|uniref:DUF1513 domain-containing protein n=1 Tax=Paracoccus luteus TaxID=2508543 RepID=UPI00106F98BD|nr:DUF1513 domain-containing protein [Paracoccus luteus]